MAPAVGLRHLYLVQSAGQLLLVALVATALFTFYAVYRRRYLLHWGLSWSAHAAYLLGAAGSSALTSALGGSALLRVLASVVSIFAGFLEISWLLLGAWELAGRRDASRRHSLAAVAAGLLVGLVSLAAFGVGGRLDPDAFLGRLGLRWLFAGLAYLIAAVSLLWGGGRRPAAFGRNFMAAALALCGVEQGGYLALALRRGSGPEPFALMGIIDLAAMAGLGLAVVIWLLEDERERVLHAVAETERRQRAQACVYRISEAAHSVRDLNELFRSIHASIAAAMPAPNLYIALVDRDQNTLSFPYFVDERDPPPEPTPLGRGATEYVLRTRRPLFGTQEAFHDLEARGEVEPVGSDAAYWLGVPLLRGSEAFGVLAVQSYDTAVRLGLEEQELLVFVSEQVASAIEAKRVEEALRLGEARLRQVIDIVPHFIFAKDVDGRFLLVNRAVAEAYGTTVEQLLGKRDADYARSPEEAESFRRDDLEVISSGRPKLHVEEPITDAAGRVRWLQTSKIPFTVSGSASPAVLGVSLDITEQRAAADAVLRAAKEESLSVLAGGVAHDFNNLLAALLGHVSLALAKLAEGDPARGHVEKAAAVVERAASLTRQMLAYSGRGRFVVKALDLGAIVRETLPLLEVALPKRVALVAHLADRPLTVQADEGQLQQVLMNLVINAAEAIGDRSGSVSVTTGIQRLSGEECPAWQVGADPLAPGEYVLLEVADDGPGMDQDTQRRIFDPFFSTKFTGRGLGLAAVLGIVRGHGGGLSLESAPGAGTAFRLLFASTAATPATAPETPASRTGERLRILVIDDEDVVRDMVAEVLGYEGYDVLQAADGNAGVEVFRRHAPGIDAVLLDLSMPGLSGEETFARLLEIRDDVPVILSSGYDNAEAVRRFPGRSPVGFIQKPYRPGDLVDEIRRCRRLAAC